MCAGGRGGKGTWGGLLDIDDDLVLDRNDPNYISNEVVDFLWLCFLYLVPKFNGLFPLRSFANNNHY